MNPNRKAPGNKIMRRTELTTWLFWASAGTLAYTYAGFPLLTALRAAAAPRAVAAGAGQLPTLSIIIAAHNEAEVIVAKLANMLALDYPRQLVEVIVASDGSDDGTDALVAGYGAANVSLLALARRGKNQTLNAAVAAASGEILVFSDADSMLERAALRYLVAPFGDPQVGGVGGDFRYAGAGAGGEGAYWSFDRALKAWQSRADSMTSATGQIYAIRRELFRSLPAGVTDDFFISVQVPAARRRLVFEPRAVATGPIARSARAEFRRKVRVIVAGLRGVWLTRGALNPRTHGVFAVQLFSHKVLRRLAVAPLLALSLTAPLLWRRGLAYRLAAAGLWGVHGLGLLGFLLQRRRLGRLKIFSLPFFFELVNAATLVALAGLARGERHDQWVPERASPAYKEG